MNFMVGPIPTFFTGRQSFSVVGTATAGVLRIYHRWPVISEAAGSSAKGTGEAMRKECRSHKASRWFSTVHKCASGIVFCVQYFGLNPQLFSGVPNVEPKLCYMTCTQLSKACLRIFVSRPIHGD